MDRLVMRNVLSLAYMPRARACYLDRTGATAASRDLTGKVRLAIDVVRGEVERAAVESSTLNRADVEQCLREGAFEIEVPRVVRNDAPVTAILNLVFRPQTPEKQARRRSGRGRRPDRPLIEEAQKRDEQAEAARSGPPPPSRPEPAQGPLPRARPASRAKPAIFRAHERRQIRSPPAAVPGRRLHRRHRRRRPLPRLRAEPRGGEERRAGRVRAAAGDEDEDDDDADERRGRGTADADAERRRARRPAAGVRSRTDGCARTAAASASSAPTAFATSAAKKLIKLRVMPSVAVIGASNAPHKYGNKAVRAYLRQGWTVYPVNPNEKTIEGLTVYASLADVPGPVDRVSMYVPPSVGITLLDAIKAKAPGELFLNPGSESDELIERADRARPRPDPGLLDRRHRRAPVAPPERRPRRRVVGRGALGARP